MTDGRDPAAGASEATAAADGAARLEVTDLEVGVGARGANVVRDISFTVRAGEVLGLVGESGSGKTTVALSLLGHARRGLQIRSGSVLLDGINLVALHPRELRAVRGAKVSYVPQEPSAALNPTRRIGSMLEEALQAHSYTRAGDRVAEVLQEVRLPSTPDMLRRYPHQLSGGQQQRVAIALAFCCRPSLIVLDEPTTGLDVTTQRHVLETVRTMCRSYGVAAVYVTHDLAVLSGLATSVAVMYAGRIVEMGDMREVFRSPVHPYTRGLMAAVPSPDRAEVLTGIDGQPPRPGRRPPGCTFAPRCPHVIDACRATSPELVMISGREVRCLRAAEIPRQDTKRPVLVTSESAAQTPPMLGITGLAARYGPVQVLFDASFELEPESCLAVVGESGSGKTTLARCIAGLHPNWNGQVVFDGLHLATRARDRPRPVLKRIQYVFQNPYTSLNPRKTIGQVIAQPLEHFLDLSFRERSDLVIKALDDVRLGRDFLERYPDQLSGGERQRAAIARALVVEPDLLICDEVTSALDVSVQAVIVELLRRLQRERRLAMIFITHNLALVRSIARDVVVLRAGHVVETGPVDQVLAHPHDPYTIKLIEDAPKLASNIANQQGQMPEVSA
jgi:peptide/nickel transport system ATP-binding protein